MGVKPCRFISAAIQSAKHAWKASGSSRQKTRRNVSWDGTPPGRVRKVLSQSRFDSAYSAISCQLLAPHRTAQMAMNTISSRRWTFPCSRRGSGSAAKCSRIEAGSLEREEDEVSDMRVMAQTSLKRCGDPGDRCYRKRSIPGQPNRTGEASRTCLERQAFLL